MEKSEYKNIFSLEQSHGWYQGMKDISLQILEKYLPKKAAFKTANLKILDAGCGTGMMAVELTKFGQVSAIDASQQAINFALKRGVKAKIGNINQLTFKSNYFDLVTSFDVLYIDGVNPKKALSEIYRVLKPGGIGLIRVPAFEFLRGRHDLMVHTARRFTKTELTQLSNHQGFTILKITYLNFFFFLFTLIKRSLEKNSRSPKSDIERLSFPFNWLVYKLLNLEGKIINYLSFPFGVSLMAVIQK